MERHETADSVRYDLHDLTAGVSTMEEVWSYLSGYTGIGAFHSCNPHNQHAWHGMVKRQSNIRGCRQYSRAIDVDCIR